ncbi:PAS domain S-box protein, partial [Hydrogenivirga sp. 128-5-R1-1]|uniref:PAS domain-containing protein n=1 Tax=Hydrogenivirga sp. 128-5-R1-1 TaxID=392423 RepID=UPI00015F03B5
MKLTDLAVKEILETIPAIIILYGEEIVYVNRYALELTGYKEEEIIGKAIWDFCPIHCKDEIKERVLKRIKGQFFEETTEIVPFKKKNGDVIYLKSTCKTIEVNDKHYGLILAIDITTQVKLEEKLKQNINELSLIFRYSPDIIVKLNKDGIILFKSYAAKKLGYNPRDV